MSASTKTLRAGVIGVGHLGRHHARHLHELPGVELVGVVDTDAERAEEIAKRHDARVFPDAKTLASEIDVATVAASTTVHEDVATPLLKAGVATLVEKPIASTAEEGRRLVELAANKGTLLAVGHIERCQPVVEELRQIVSRPRFIEIHRLAPFKPRSLDVDVVLDLMIHDFDLCRFLIGDHEVVSFDASGTPAFTDRIDIASARVRFDNGAAANLTASRISVEPVRRIRVFEPGAYFSCDTAAARLARFTVEKKSTSLPKVDMQPMPVPSGDALARELTIFLDAARNGGRPACTGEEGLAALELALTVRASIEEQNRSA